MRMGVIKTSKDQDLLVSDSSETQEKGKSKKKEPKVADSKPKQNQQASEGASDSKKKNAKSSKEDEPRRKYYLVSVLSGSITNSANSWLVDSCNIPKTDIL